MLSNGTIVQTWSSSDGLFSDNVNRLAISGNNLLSVNSDSAISIIEMTSNSITSYDENSGLASSLIGDIATFGNMAYIATSDIGLARLDMTNQTFLAPWGSTGVNNANNVPLAVFDDILHMGLPGYGVVRKDLTNGEILLPLVENSDINGIEILPNDNIYALISDGAALYIGADDGAVKWDGVQSVDFAGRGQSWVTQPDQFFDFALLGNDIYVGTDRGVCKYPTATLVVDDCQNVYDGMPDWATYSVGTDGSQIYGGTNDGVGILTANPFEVVDLSLIHI